MAEYRLGEIEMKFAEFIWSNEPIPLGELASNYGLAIKMFLAFGQWLSCILFFHGSLACQWDFGTMPIYRKK